MHKSYREASLRKSLMVELMDSNSPIGDSRFFQVETTDGEAVPQGHGAGAPYLIKYHVRLIRTGLAPSYPPLPCTCAFARNPMLAC